MRILIGAAGTGGDLDPFITLGQGLQARGHEVIIISGAAYRERVELAGLAFHAAALDAANAKVAEYLDEDTIVAKKMLLNVADRMVNLVFAPFFDAVGVLANDNTLLIYGSLLQFVGASASEKFNLPAIFVNLAPIGFLSALRPPRVSADDALNKIPALILKTRLLPHLISLFVIGPYTKPLNQWRAKYGLAPIRFYQYNNWSRAFDVPDKRRMLCLFPAWFAKPIHAWSVNRLPEDLPLNSIETAGFMLHSQASHQTLTPEIKLFLEKYPRPVLFTFGTGMIWDGMKNFFQVSVEACQKLNLPAILLSKNSQDFPDNLPAHVLCLNFIALETLLPQVCLIVHHVGIGTLAQAMVAKVPQLAVPFRYDQFDNATRLCNLGVGDELLPTDYTVENLVNKIAAGLKDAEAHPEKYAHLAELTQQSGGAHAVEKACDFIEKFYREYKLKTIV